MSTNRNSWQTPFRTELFAAGRSRTLKSLRRYWRRRNGEADGSPHPVLPSDGTIIDFLGLYEEVQASRQNMEKILVVEDDRAVQNALKRLFASNGYSVEIAATGAAGLESVRAGLPSAVVLDLRLPGIPGQDVCREIKNA